MHELNIFHEVKNYKNFSFLLMDQSCGKSRKVGDLLAEGGEIIILSVASELTLH